MDYIHVDFLEDEPEVEKPVIRIEKPQPNDPPPPIRPLIPVGVIKPLNVKFQEVKVESKDTFPTDKNLVFASSRQKGNPMLNHLLHIKIEFREIVPDFCLGKMSCMLYISLKFHQNNPKYLFERIHKLGSLFSLRIILCRVDLPDTECGNLINELNELCLHGDCTLMLCWSDIEAARYLETYKLFEKKSASVIQPKVDNDYIPRLQDTLTSIKRVNKTDAITLASNFGSLKSIMNATREEYDLCPGLGEKKAQRMLDLFSAPLKGGTKVPVKSNQKTIDSFIK